MTDFESFEIKTFRLITDSIQKLMGRPTMPRLPIEEEIPCLYCGDTDTVDTPIQMWCNTCQRSFDPDEDPLEESLDEIHRRENWVLDHE